MMTAATARLALSLSGGGHLLPYHLAVCETLLDASKLEKIPPIEAISGSSAGTIAATVSCRLPSHCLSEFAEKFIQQRGHGLKLLKEFLSPKNDREHLPRLHVCTTRCSDGTAHVFSEKDLDTREKLLTCVQASCTIPRSFHPMDVLESSGSLVYPDSDGILIDGGYHVDGGIAAPAPPIPGYHDGEVIVVSPISGSRRWGEYRISPRDSSFSIWTELTCRGGFDVKPSIQNLRALRVASGSTSLTELQSWYNQGIDDANMFLKEWQ
jgi:predicted acylesterase/phospholipase RssA